MRLATVLKNLKREISKQLLHLVVVFKHVNLSKTGILIIYIYIYIYTHTHTHTHTQYGYGNTVCKVNKYTTLRPVGTFEVMTGKCNAKKIIVGH